MTDIELSNNQLMIVRKLVFKSQMKRKKIKVRMNNDGINHIDIQKFAQMLKVLGEPNRLKLLNKIIEGVQCNCELGKSLSLAPNLVSHHLSVLCDSGLVLSKRDQNDARWIYYSIDEIVLDQIGQSFNIFFDGSRIKPCLSSCGPKFSQGQ